MVLSPVLHVGRVLLKKVGQGIRRMVKKRANKPAKHPVESPKPKPPRKRRGSDAESEEDAYGIDKLAIFLFVAVPLTVTCLIGYYYYQNMLRTLVSRPSDDPLIITKERAEDMTRFWGTYRPGVYFGTKTRSANSPVTGLMWFEQQLPAKPNIRHWCEQGDHLTKYGWLKHNGNDFGVQELHDSGVLIKTEYVKRLGGRNGGDWSARITATQPEGQAPKRFSLMYYFATDGVSRINPTFDHHDRNHLQSLAGYDSELGEFKVSFTSSASVPTYDHMVSYTPGYEHIQTVLGYAFNMRHVNSVEHLGLKGRFVPQDSPGANIYVYQVTAQLPITLEVMYESESFDNRPNRLQGSDLSKELEMKSHEFDMQFEEKFGLKAKGYSKDKIEFAQAAMSNMLGGIGFFFGSSRVQSKYNEEPINYWESTLFTAVPSRSFFPRGFLWDEGFHNLLIKEWDEEITLDIIGHWMDLMNSEGWIPREQILGGEARAKVPDEFVVQRNQNANPPTFFLPLQSVIQSLIKQNTNYSKEYLKHLYPRLRTWYNWFNKTQAGDLPHTYRWKGRDGDAVRERNPKTLTSGLDDYPRASHPSDSERHLDLRCWMALASKVMASIAESLGESHELYQHTYEKLSDNKLLNQLHWSDKSKRYADYGLHTDATTLKRPPIPKNLKPGQPIPHRDMERVVSSEPAEQLVTSYFGYVSLFPMLTQILDTGSEQLGHILKQLKDEKLLWTQYGLRSLAKSSPLYQKRNTEHDPPYWRGAIWININYLAVRSLHYYGTVEGPHKQLAAELHVQLRDNIINNIEREYRRTGYIWEQYDDKTGEGKGCHPFTGWSALVTLMMADK